MTPFADPLLPHLLDILQAPAARDLILAGGLGLNLKRHILLQEGGETLVSAADWPDARATQDLDFFLRMTIFTAKARAQEFADLLQDLDYGVHKELFQFGKSVGEAPLEMLVKVDLLSRQPKDEDGVRHDRVRVGNRSGNPVHGRTTPEAFAIDRIPQTLHVAGASTTGAEIECGVLVPHPFSWLNMKVRAAHDWLDERNGKIEPRSIPRSPKHVFDVIMILAMLTPSAQQESQQLATEFREHPEAIAIRAEAVELFAQETSQGWIEFRSQTGTDLDHSLFWESLSTCLETE